MVKAARVRQAGGRGEGARIAGLEEESLGLLGLELPQCLGCRGSFE